MTFWQAVRTCFARFLTFSGRASRAEYWYFVLFAVMCNAAAALIDWMFFTQVTTIETDGGTAVVAVSGQPARTIVNLILFLPLLAAAWRRMHDTGRSGWFVLLPTLLTAAAFAVLIFGLGLASSFQPGGSLDILFTRATLLIVIPTLVVLFFSPLLVLWWLTRPSQPGPNKYGPNPHEVAP